MGGRHMARPKKPTYEYVAKLNRYRKRIKNADGKYAAIYGKTPEELTEKLAEATKQVEEGLVDRAYPTVNAYADLWLELHSPNISYATKQDYRYIIKRHMKEPLGNFRMADVTQDNIKAALLSVADKSESVYQRTVMLYKQIFDSAVDSNIIASSPCRKLKSGGVPPKKKHALSKEQIEILLNAIRETKVYTFIMVGLYAGLRREEILGLKWANVVLTGSAPHISVRSALRWEHNRPIVTDTLKSKAATRDIPIPPQLVECLKAAKATSNSEHVISDAKGLPLTETQFRNMWHAVICRTVKERTYTKYTDAGKVVHTISPQKGEKASHRKYCYTIDFEVTPHILRHTYISNLLLSGVDVKTVQYLAGHEHAKITLDIYTHLIYNKPQDLMEKVNKAFAVTNEVKISGEL